MTATQNPNAVRLISSEDLPLFLVRSGTAVKIAGWFKREDGVIAWSTHLVNRHTPEEAKNYFGILTNAFIGAGFR